MSSYQQNASCKEFQMIEFDNGYYQGEMQSMKREGFGVFYWDSGQIYLGKWSKDYMEDEGVVYFSEGGCAYGNFRRNKLNGYACVIDPFENMIVGHFSKGILENGVWLEKSTNKWFRYDVQNCEPNRNYELTTKSQIPQVVTLKEVIKRIFHGCHGRTCIKYIEYPDTTFYLGVAADNSKSPSGLGVLHDYDSKVLQVGHHKGKKLNGVGRQYLGFMINDGIFEKQEFKYGTQYFIRDKKFFYGFFNGNQIKKIIKSGTGYPSYLLAYYKHPSKYANAKIDKEQEQEVMLNYQSQYVHSNNIVGYSEIYKCSPKKKNLLLFVENKFSEDFISPHTSVYQEVLEAAQYQRTQKQNCSHSPMMQKKNLQIYEEDEDSNYQSKQLTSKISPSSQSSYTPSNLRLNNLKNKQTSKQKDFFNSSTDKKKNKSVDIQQSENQSTQKKLKNAQNMQMRESNSSSNQDSQQHIFIQDGNQFSSIDTQTQEQQFNKQVINQSMKNSNSSMNSVEMSHLKSEKLQQQKALKGSNQSDKNKCKKNLNPFDEKMDQKKNQNFSQSSSNRSKQNSITSPKQNKQEIQVYSLYSSMNQSSKLTDNQNMHFFQPTVSIQDEQLIKQQILWQEKEKQSYQSTQFQFNEQQDSAEDNNNFNEENMQMQIQQMLQTFNAKNQNQLHGNKLLVEQNHIHITNEGHLLQSSKIKESIQIQNNAQQREMTQFNEYSLGSQQMNEMLGSQYQNQLLESKKINLEEQPYQQRENEQNDQELFNHNNQQAQNQLFYEDIPNTMAPDNKIESTSRRNSSEIHIEESTNINDKRKHETPRFDLKQANKKLLNELDDSYKNAAKEVSSLFQDIKNQIQSQEQLHNNDLKGSIQSNNNSNSINQCYENEENHFERRDTFQQENNHKELENMQNSNSYLNVNQQLVDTFQNYQKEDINERKEIQEQNNINSFSIQQQQIDYKINQPTFQLDSQSPENIQEDLIEQIKRMRKNTNDSTNKQNNYQTIQKNISQNNEQKNIVDFVGEYYNSNNQSILEDSLYRNGFDVRDRLESIQLPVTPALSYNYQDKRTENVKMDKNGFNKLNRDQVNLEDTKHEESIRISDTQNQLIIQKLSNLNQVKKRKETSDSFECNIASSQNDFTDSLAQVQVQSVKNEENYKSLMQIIPENKEAESTKNSAIQQQNLKNQNLDQTRYKSVSVVSFDHLQKNSRNNVHLMNQNFYYEKQQSDLQNSKEDLNCTIEEEDEEKKTKFHFINQSPSRPFLTQTSAYKKRRRIFENPLNSSFSTVSPSMSKHTYSPMQNQSMHMNVFLPQNNEQRVSDFNFKKVMENQVQNKLEYSAKDLQEIKQFNFEKNRIDTNNSFDKLNISGNQLMFTNPQMNQEYSTQNSNNYFTTNTTHARNKSHTSSNQFISNQLYNQNPHQINQQKINNIHPQTNQNQHQRIYSQQDFNKSYNSIQTLQDFHCANKNNNFDHQKQNQNHFNSYNPQVILLNKQSLLKNENQKQEIRQLSSQFLNKNLNEQNDHFQNQNQNELSWNDRQKKPETKTLRQIMDTSIDKSQSPTYQGFFYQNGLQSKKANFFTNSGCEPVKSFKVQPKDFKDSYHSSKFELSRQLQQSLNDLSEQNLSFTSASHQMNNQLNSQNDLVFYDEENNKINIKKSGQKPSTQFQPVQNDSSIQSKENNSFHPSFSHKQRQNKFNLNINLSSINDQTTKQKDSKIQSLSQSSKNTISLSEILRQKQSKNQNTSQQFKSFTPSNTQKKQSSTQFTPQNFFSSNKNNFKQI